MAAFVCRFCGAPLETGGMPVCECGSCNRLQSVPLLDSTEKRELMARAEQLRGERRFDKAMQLFERMISLSPQDADLYWALALSKFGVLFSYDGGVSLCRTQAHSFLADSDYIRAVGFAEGRQRVFMEQTAAQIDKKRREIAGLSAGAEYDAILCCRSGEVQRVSGLYRRLVSEKINVFFAEVTLDGKPKSEWEPYIFGALNSAGVLIAALSGGDFDEDAALADLCGRFLSGDMAGRAVIPVLYGITPGELPAELARFQAVSADSLGFEMDVAASIRALLSGRDGEVPQEKSPLVRRAYIMLSDGEFSGAEKLCERIEPQAPAEAALIRMLCEYRLKSEEALGGLSADITQSENYRRAMQGGSEPTRLRLKKYALSAQENLKAETARRAAIPTLPADGSEKVYSSAVKPIRRRRFLPLAAAGIAAAGIVAAAAIIVNCAGNPGTAAADGASVVSEEKTELDRARALFDEGKYIEAEAAFSALPDQETGAAWVKKCRYMQAEQLLAEGDPENARSIFSRLGDYGDSAKRAMECDFLSAEQAEERGEYEAAAAAFDALGSFKNSKARKNGCLYKLASGLLESGETDSAQALFEKLGSYSDSADKLKEIQYRRADEQYGLGNFSEAYDMFSGLGGWSDSAERAADALYRQAETLYENGQYREAISPLTGLGDRPGCRELLNACWVAVAAEKIDSGAKDDAYDILTYRVDEDYAPAQPYFTKLQNELLRGASWRKYLCWGKYDTNGFGSPSAVKWHLLRTDGDRALIAAESALEYLPFDVNGGSSWAESSLRSWLNGEFYDSAFTDGEKQLILESSHDGAQDRVFLLKYDEAVSMYERTTDTDSLYATFYTYDKLPDGYTALCWGRDGILSHRKSETGYERLYASPLEPNLVFPAMWVKIG